MTDMIEQTAGEADQAEYAAAAELALSRPDNAAFIPCEAISALGHTLIAEFKQAENDRRSTELRWLRDLRQFRGIYDPEVEAMFDANQSRAFVRKTRVKVKTVTARMMELLFPGNSEKNFQIAPTPVPTLPKEFRDEIVKQLSSLNKVQKPTDAQIDETAKMVVNEAAKAMSKQIEDQLEEAKYKNIAKQVLHSGNVFGTGVLKAPLVERKIRMRYVRKGGKWELKTESYVVPFVDFVPLWRFYPDMAATEIDDCRYVYERHLMTKTAMFKLCDRKSFSGAKIKNYVETHPDGEFQVRHYDTELKSIGSRDSVPDLKSGMFEVIERWGWLSGTELKDAGAKIPKDRMHESFFSNVWLFPNGEVIRAVLQPINGVTWPYHLYYFDKDETSIFGEGISAIIRDDQTMLNAATRMILDNGAMVAGSMYEVNPSLLTMPRDTINDIRPRKVYIRNNDRPEATAIRSISFDSHLNELAAIAERFDANADEVSAIPRYMSGENATQGAAGTASGMSMLMGAVNIGIKDLVTNYDEGVTKRFIEGLYRWNMQFSSNNKIKGDFDVKATGTSSLVAKEVRAQQLGFFAAQTSNPMDAPFIKRDKLLRQRAESLDLIDVVKTEEEVAAEINNPALMAQQQAAQEEQMLRIKKLAAELEEVMARVAKIRAEAVQKNVGSAYSAMQAGGVVAQAPGVAPVGDEILRSAGWVDATPQSSVDQTAGNVQQQAEQIPEMQGAGDGMQQGIETQAIDGNPVRQ